MSFQSSKFKVQGSRFGVLLLLLSFSIGLATLVRPRCADLTNGCPLAKSNLLIHFNAPLVPQFQWVRLWVSPKCDMSEEWIYATNRTGTGGTFRVAFTNGQQLFCVVAYVDEALPYDTAWRKR